MSSAPSHASASAASVASVQWDELLKTALLGTERASAVATSHPDPQLAALLQQQKDQTQEAALLTAAALISSYESSGMIAGTAGDLSLSSCAQDDRPRCGTGAASYLRRIFGGQFLFLLPEFLLEVHAAKKRMPEELLPELLEAARKDSSIRAAVAAVIGQRGEWLAKLNQDWNFIGAQITREQWETGTRADRLALLHQLRQSAPREAVVLLQSTWAADAPEDRAAFIAELQHALTMEDEPFLEAALDDRRKEVRKQAAELLMRLPQSALVERMWQRVSPLLRMKESAGSKLKKLLGKPVLEVTLPQQCDAAMQSDGVDLKPPQGTGEKAWWLQQMVRAVPPQRWERHLQLTAEQCVAAFNESEFYTALLPASADAAWRHKDPRWAKAVLEAGMARGKEAGPIPVPGSNWEILLEAVEVMNPGERDALIIRTLDRHSNMADLTWGTKLLHSCPGPWSELLGRSFLNVLRSMTQQMSAGKVSPYWHGLGDLNDLACRMPVSLTEEAQHGWPEDAPAKTWFRPIQTVIEVLQFRSKMFKEISR